MVGSDPQEHLTLLLDVFNPIVLGNESEYRVALRVYLDTWFKSRCRGDGATAKVRAGRRMRWLEQTLKPLLTQLSAPLRRRLKNALALTLGIDSIVIMRDVCGLDDKEGLDVLRWTAQIILEAVMKETQNETTSVG
jgi:hypothetical protein